MRTIVPVIMTTVLGLALMPASAATKHKRHNQAATAPQQQIACTVVGACPFHAAAIPRWATRRGEHQPALMWRRVRATRFTETDANRRSASP